MHESGFETDIIVIGAGVIGLACARALALKGFEVILLEAEAQIAAHTSSRNSEVIHAGLYYAEGSLKARFCVEGRRALTNYLDARGVTRNPCGKLVVATNDEEAEALAALKARADRNGVEALRLISGTEARALEPALSQDIRAALHSPVSGIFDSHAYFLALQGDLEDAGGHVVLASPVEHGRQAGARICLKTGGDSPAEITARWVINAAGHRAVEMAARIEGPHTVTLPEMRFVKGSYFTVSGKTPFSRLIYPMPTTASLGLHLTIDLGGRGKLGPDAEWLPAGMVPPFDYRVDPGRAERFYASVRRYWPSLPDGALMPDYAGIRPKLVNEGEPSGDFRIDGPGEHGTPGLINLFGIESPGLTSSLAIAEHVAELTR
ncbi:MAG: NAD(P)/FAD-dependent oxidoreductase [Hyphomonadaceae bacterium]|nr:NAD(P)/FAD-dependent oxidoreductase [Hyphomonadaceae bacterium]